MNAFGQAGFGSRNRQNQLRAQGQMDPYGNQVRQAKQAPTFNIYNQQPAPSSRSAAPRQQPASMPAGGGQPQTSGPMPMPPGVTQPATPPAQPQTAGPMPTMGQAQPMPTLSQGTPYGGGPAPARATQFDGQPVDPNSLDPNAFSKYPFWSEHALNTVHASRAMEKYHNQTKDAFTTFVSGDRSPENRRAMEAEYARIEAAQQAEQQQYAWDPARGSAVNTLRPSQVELLQAMYPSGTNYGLRPQRYF
jgi:hypothetical protein